jgi:sulfite reductase (NADPH) flavoprotein alpha-component
MREHAREVWQWLDAGAHLYVCGDATHMTKDVEAALTEIVAAGGAFTHETALEFVHALRKTNRYQRDVY